MLLGQRLNSTNNLLGHKVLHNTMKLGQKIMKAKQFSDNVNGIRNDVKKVYLNLEKINARKRLQ